MSENKLHATPVEPGVQYNINFVVEAPVGLDIASKDLSAAVEAAVLDQGVFPVISQVRSLKNDEAPQVWIGDDPESGGRAVDVREIVGVWERVAEWGGIEHIKNLVRFAQGFESSTEDAADAKKWRDLQAINDYDNRARGFGTSTYDPETDAMDGGRLG